MMQVGKFQSFILRKIGQSPLTTDESSFNLTSSVILFGWWKESL